MKKSIILIVCLVIISSSSLFASPFNGGDGSSSNPYQIYSETQLLALVNANNATTWTQHYILTNDITCSGSYTNTIGNSSFNFTGSFNGQGYTISNLTMNLNNEYVGLFGYVSSSATITNLILADVNITNSYTGSNESFLGALAGYITSSTITNCAVTGSVTANTPSSFNHCGGLIGWNEGTVLNCLSTASVSCSSYWQHVGGCIGDNFNQIRNCYATGNVSATLTSSATVSTVGGFLGYSEWAASYNCYATGNITGGYSAAGFIGDNYMSDIYYCYSTGASTSATYTGGFCGNNEGGNSYTCCYSNTETSYLANAEGYGGATGVTGLTSAQMLTPSIFTTCGWSTAIWDLSTSRFPQLKNMPLITIVSTPTLTEWSRYILIFSVLLFGCYFVCRKIYV
jgi:hypothetical protein